MARPSYLSYLCRRCYYLQVRAGNGTKAFCGRRILRASSRISDFCEARKRLMDGRGWAKELIDAPDLEALGGGHASAVPGRYGRKSKIDPAQVAAIEKLEPGVVKTMREILVAAKEKADRGELTVLKPWLKKCSSAAVALRLKSN